MAATIAARASILGLIATSAAAASVALVTGHGAPVPPPPPSFVCVVPDVTLQATCARPEDRFVLSTTAPADLGLHAIETASGLRVRVLDTACGGPSHPSTADVALVAYVGWNARGEIITSGVETSELPLRALVPGFAEAVERMTPGESLRAWIPARLAYGDKMGAKYAGDLVFDLHLVSFRADPRDR